MKLPTIASMGDLVRLIDDIGFVPFFPNDIPGFSIKECVLPELWFADDVEGPWEWKGPVINDTHCAYGKLFRGKSGYVSREWYLELANMRRERYDFYELYEAGLISHQEKLIYDVLSETSSMLSKDLKWRSGFGRDGQKGFDIAMTRLQMKCLAVIVDFEYERDKFAKPYGWGVARYATPENYFGREFIEALGRKPPEESKRLIVDHLTSVVGAENEKGVLKLIS